jgi:hypothetical protein
MIDRSKLETGDRYIDFNAAGYENKYVIRYVRKDGNDAFASGGGSGLYGGLFGGVLEFDTLADAEKWIEDHPLKKKKVYELEQRTKDFIRRNINGKKGKHLYGTNENGEYCRILLTGLALDFYNSIG